MVILQWGTSPNNNTISLVKYMNIMQCYVTVLGSDWPAVILPVTWDCTLNML